MVEEEVEEEIEDEIEEELEEVEEVEIDLSVGERFAKVLMEELDEEYE